MIFFFFNVDPLHILPAGVFCLFFAYVFLVGIYKVAPTKPDTRELKPRMNLKGGGANSVLSVRSEWNRHVGQSHRGIKGKPPLM